MTRRHALKALSAGALSLILPEPVVAAPPEREPSARPYEFITPPVTTDRNVVRLLFAYSCAYCRRYHSGISQWGRTLPKSLTFVATPVLTATDESSMAAIFGRLIVERIAPEHLGRYDHTMFERVQDNPTPLSVSDLLRSIVQIGIDQQILRQFVGTPVMQEIEGLLPQHARHVQTYGLTATPTVALAGKLRVTPDNAQGDSQRFALLLNGLVSRLLEGVPLDS